MSSNSALPPNDQEMTLIQHLLDLKTTLTHSIIAIIVFFIFLFPFANQIYTYVAEPLTRYLPEGTSMIATAVASPFLTPFKLSFVLAIYLAMPYLLYQLWRFISPALYKHERQLVAPLLFFSSFLFYAGGLFAYYIVFPLVFGFLTQTAPEGVTIATDISLYLDFVIKMFFAFGMAFEVPIVTVLLILTGMVNPDKLRHSRPYIIVGAFVVGMLLTPPDVISQTLLAVPMWLLFEVGLFVGERVKTRRDIAAAEREDNESDEMPEKSGHQDNPTANTAQQQDTPEYEFDDRYADQVNDDFDWDNEFDKIESEMSILDKEYNKRQAAEKAARDAAESGKTPTDKTPDSQTGQTDETTERGTNAQSQEESPKDGDKGSKP